MAYAVLSELPINKLKAVFFPLLDTLGINAGLENRNKTVIRLYRIRVCIKIIRQKIGQK